MAADALPPVWPHPSGADLALSDDELGQRRALVDAIRAGDAGIRRLAEQVLLDSLRDAAFFARRSTAASSAAVAIRRRGRADPNHEAGRFAPKPDRATGASSSLQPPSLTFCAPKQASENTLQGSGARSANRGLFL